MYYYIFEPEKKFRRTLANRQLRRLLFREGITAEIATPNPARDLAEILETASQRKFSTIVAVGEDAFLNKVASAFRQTEPINRTVLGFIPYELKGEIASFLGIANLNEAVLALKRRRLKKIYLGKINQNYFLTTVGLTLSKPALFQLNIDGLELKTALSHLTIKRSDKLSINFWNKNTLPHPVLGLFYWLFGKKIKPDVTVLSGRLIKIKAPSGITLEGGEIEAKTPLSVELDNFPLQIIVLRSKI
ncbi:hypothetical protein HY373_01535 [Candidatus Berkelbacteria bacterium]|nr:hypothetical protein [Candidatus Berkelbacteria bacterium]MBI2588418.1 hypothetical protein [Candidatus Berkelbacteria bacterium]MBI4029840.1 hypothetical protein [Candidatus Berkelbacteria bacterium]